MFSVPLWDKEHLVTVISCSIFLIYLLSNQRCLCEMDSFDMKWRTMGDAVSYIF